MLRRSDMATCAVEMRLVILTSRVDMQPQTNAASVAIKIAAAVPIS